MVTFVLTRECVSRYSFHILIIASSLLILGFLFEPRVVHAQLDSGVSGSDEMLSATSSTSSDLFVAPEVTSTTTVNPPWYQTDQITGQGIDRGDFVVGPGRVELTVRPGETVVRDITLTNRISDNRRFELLVEDVAGTSDGGSVQLLGSERGPYTLKDYISFPGNEVLLDLGERARIPVTITIPADAEPGGRYGSVLITTVRDDGTEADESAPATRSPIIARLGILFFITIPGDIERSGSMIDLTKIGNPLWYEEGPIALGISFENTGSVHLNPYGELRVKNMFGEEVGFMEIDPWFVLPKSMRTREIMWDREFLLGRYTATVALNRGYDDRVDEQTITFWVLPWKVVGGTFLVIFVVLLAIRAFFKTFEFKRKQP